MSEYEGIDDDPISNRITIYATTAIKNIKLVEKRDYQDTSRVGSNLEVHECSSFRLGAARACELEDVKSVKVIVSGGIEHHQ